MYLTCNLFHFCYFSYSTQSCYVYEQVSFKALKSEPGPQSSSCVTFQMDHIVFWEHFDTWYWTSQGVYREIRHFWCTFLPFSNSNKIRNRINLHIWQFVEILSFSRSNGWFIFCFFFVVEKHLSSFKLLMQDVDNETPYIFVSEYL